jgi:hypothetical protein
VLPQKLEDVGILVNKKGYVEEEVIAKGPNNKNRKTKREQALDELLATDTDEKGDVGMEGEAA